MAYNMLTVFGKNGEIYSVNQGIGLGIREHDDVMLAWGYSHHVTKIVTIPAGNFAVITMTMPPNLSHHAESRYLEAYGGILKVKVIAGLEEENLPSVVNQIPAWNEKGPYRNDTVQSVFHWRGVHTSNPITGVTIDDQNTVDEIHIHAQSGNTRQASEQSNSSVKGRYYTEGIWTALVENVSNDDVEFTYIYSWHEFE